MAMPVYIQAGPIMRDIGQLNLSTIKAHQLVASVYNKVRNETSDKGHQRTVVLKKSMNSPKESLKPNQNG